MDAALYTAYAQAEDAHWWFRARRRIVARVLDGLDLPAPARILEMGCATGGNLDLLSRYGTLDAVEMDAGAAAFARSRQTQASVYQGHLPDAVPPAVDGPYDLITLLDVLEHIPDDRAALDRLFALTAPGGVLLVTVPAYQWLWSAHDVANHHQRRYRRGALVRLLRSAGFQVERATYFNTLLLPVVAGIRVAGTLAERVRGRKPVGSDIDTIPPRPVNRLLEGVFASERAWVSRLSAPAGVSILALARRPELGL
jgi:trans-aconitate methyltransferase